MVGREVFFKIERGTEARLPFIPVSLHPFRGNSTPRDFEEIEISKEFW